MSAIILFSGGLDSTVAAVQAATINKHIKLLTIDYGSMHAAAEARAARKVALLLAKASQDDITWHIPVPFKVSRALFEGGTSALMGDSKMPNAQYQNLDTEGPSSTVVPFRNANLISIATAFAEKEEYEYVYIAAHATDYNRWAYPDCTPEFIGAMMNAVYVGTYHKVRLVAPFLWMTKTDVVRRGLELGAPLKETWSCYRGGEKHCGTCPTCIERHKAFIEAMTYDPTEYEHVPE